MYLHNKNIKDAEHYFLKSLEIDDTNIIVLDNLFNFYIKIRSYKKAEEINSKIEKIDQNSTALQYNKIELLIINKKFDQAEKALKEIIDKNKNVTAYLKLATVYRS